MKEYHPLFKKKGNRILLAVSAHKIIKGIAVGGIVWGVVNTVLGLFFIRADMINSGLVLLGLLMLGVGVLALAKPTRRSLLLEAIAAIVLVCWNASIEAYNYLAYGVIDSPGSIIVPLVVANTFVIYYRKLKPVEGEIDSLKPELLKASKETCKRLFKIKPKDNDNLVLFSNSKYRLLYEEGQFMFFAKNMSAAFLATPDELRELIMDPKKKKLRLVIDHPLNKVKINMNKKNTERLTALLDASVPMLPEVPLGV